MTSVASVLPLNYNSSTYFDTTDPRAQNLTAYERSNPNVIHPVEQTYGDSHTHIQLQPPMDEYLLTQGAISHLQPSVYLDNYHKLKRNEQEPINMQPSSNPNSCSGNQCTPVTDLLLPETSTMVYTDEFLNQPNANLFLQNVQPNVYSYAVDTTPINSLASGISYTPQVPPKFRDQVYNKQNGNMYPIYTRVDPQLIREQGVPARLLEQPVRSDWSSQYSSWQAAPGSVNYEDIYDPRFSGYGDPYRSYSDVLLGNVNYYYSDIDAYRMPNFITRSKVDFIEYQNPMGKVMPEYQRMASTNDTRPFVNNQWMNDTNYFRENIMEANMRPMNARNWQFRYAPLSKANHTKYASNALQGGMMQGRR
jgi:hypothetical protein